MSSARPRLTIQTAWAPLTLMKEGVAYISATPQSKALPLATGCPCCTGQDELMTALQRLYQQWVRQELTEVVILAGPETDTTALRSALLAHVFVASRYDVTEA